MGSRCCFTLRVKSGMEGNSHGMSIWSGYTSCPRAAFHYDQPRELYWALLSAHKIFLLVQCKLLSRVGTSSSGVQQSVSWKFIPEPIFNSTSFSLFLLCMHLGTCALLLGKHYRYYMKTTTPPSGTSNSLHSNYQIAILLFTTHFTGIVFSRSLHYSFYIWQVSAMLIPFLLMIASGISTLCHCYITQHQYPGYSGLFCSL